jgi:hypothetical protein
MHQSERRGGRSFMSSLASPGTLICGASQRHQGVFCGEFFLCWTPACLLHDSLFVGSFISRASLAHRNTMSLCLLALYSPAYSAGGALPGRSVGHSVAATRIAYNAAAGPRMMAEDTELSTFLTSKAGVAPKFLEAVICVCDEEMIGDVNSLKIAAEAGIVKKIFKPVVALGIEKGERHSACEFLCFHEQQCAAARVRGRARAAASLPTAPFDRPVRACMRAPAQLWEVASTCRRPRRRFLALWPSPARSSLPGSIWRPRRTMRSSTTCRSTRTSRRHRTWARSSP